MAKLIVLERWAEHQEVGTFGEILIDGQHVCFTVEQPWRDNEPFRSCVPAADYELVYYVSPKFGHTWALVNHAADVGIYEGDAKRYACLFHAANLASQLEGCIAPGLSLTTLDQMWAVGSSRAALNKLFPYFEEDTIFSIIWKDRGPKI